MKKILKERLVTEKYQYEADDGTKFDTKCQCEDYERAISDKEPSTLGEIQYMYVDDVGKCAITYIENKNSYIEFINVASEALYFSPCGYYYNTWKDSFKNHFIYLSYTDHDYSFGVHADTIDKLTASIQEDIDILTEKLEVINEFISQHEPDAQSKYILLYDDENRREYQLPELEAEIAFHILAQMSDGHYEDNDYYNRYWMNMEIASSGPYLTVYRRNPDYDDQDVPECPLFGCAIDVILNFFYTLCYEDAGFKSAVQRACVDYGNISLTDFNNIIKGWQLV